LAEVEWKGIIWKAAFGTFSYKELLTILKGYGSMEILSFEKPGHFKGMASIALNTGGTRDLTIYYLEVLGPRRAGLGRKALLELKRIFQGKIFVEDPGEILTDEYSITESILFWIQMFREGVIDGLDSDLVRLHPGIDEKEMKKLEQTVISRMKVLRHEKSS